VPLIAGSPLSVSAEDGDGQTAQGRETFNSQQVADVPDDEANLNSNPNGRGNTQVSPTQGQSLELPSLPTATSSAAPMPVEATPISEDSSSRPFDVISVQAAIDLHEAAAHGWEGIVEKILAEWSHPDVQDDKGRTPLQKAAWHGRHACVSYLVDHRADVNYDGGPDGSALEISASRGLVEIVKTLLKRGATAKDSALHKAAREGHKQVVNLLINYRANIRYKDSSGNTVLDSAIRSRSLDVLKRVLRAGGAEDVDHQNYNRQDTPLHIAARYGHGDGVQLLLEAGANLHAPGNVDSDLVIHAACIGGSAVIVQSLLSRGVDPNTDGGHRGPPLHITCEHGNEAVLGVLLENNVNVNHPGGRFGSALNAAIEMHHFVIAVRLIECGADIHGAEEGCQALLHLASLQGNDTLARLLLDKGVEPVIVIESTGTTPLYAAVLGTNGRNPLGCSQSSLETIIPGCPEARPDCGCGHLAVVKLLLERGVGTRGLTVLQYACEVKFLRDSLATGARDHKYTRDIARQMRKLLERSYDEIQERLQNDGANHGGVTPERC
jgi:ankyrin repeat protein